MELIIFIIVSVKELRIENNKLTIFTNIIIYKQKLLLFSGTKIKKISINKKIINTDCEIKKYINLIILFKKKIIPAKSYFKILEPKFFHFWRFTCQSF